MDLLVSLPIVGGAIGALLAAPLQKQIGRKRSLLVAYAVFSVPGSILQLFSPNKAAFIVGRFWNCEISNPNNFNGVSNFTADIGISLLTNITTIYQSDLVPASLRARAVGFTVAGFAASSLLATVVVWASEKLNDHRQYLIPLAIQVVVPVILFFLTFLLYESPTWLISKGRIEEARANLTILRTGNMAMVDDEVLNAMTALKAEEEYRIARKPWDILKWENFERTFSSGALYCTSQVSGQILVSTYSTVTLIQSGVANPFTITVIIYLAQMVGTIVGPPLVDKIGRRPIALYGFVIMLLLDIALGGIACAGLKTDSQRLALASLCIIFFFVDAASFQSL